MNEKYGILSYEFTELNQKVFDAVEREWGIVIKKKRDFIKLGSLQKELVYHEADKLRMASGN